MGNRLTRYHRFHGTTTINDVAGKEEEEEEEQREKPAVVQVVKMDGKILQFSASVLVKDLLIKFPPGLGVGLLSSPPDKAAAAAAAESLPLTYELKSGKVYFLFPLLTCGDRYRYHQPVYENVFRPTTTAATKAKTIKVVITKMQLKELLASKKVSFATRLVSETKIISSAIADSPPPRTKGWLPVLQSVPEGNEFGFSIV